LVRGRLSNGRGSRGDDGDARTAHVVTPTRHLPPHRLAPQSGARCCLRCNAPRARRQYAASSKAMRRELEGNAPRAGHRSQSAASCLQPNPPVHPSRVGGLSGSSGLSFSPSKVQVKNRVLCCVTATIDASREVRLASESGQHRRRNVLGSFHPPWRSSPSRYS